MVHRQLALFLLASCSLAGPASAFGFFDATGNGLAAGSRWDSAPRTMSGGLERSLNGGLRFSLQGGSYQAYRDLFTWSGTPPTVAQFEQAVLDAFAVWTTTDPATGLDTEIRFVPDLATPVSTAQGGFIRSGAEIDLFGATDGNSWNPGGTGTQAETFFSSISVAGNLTLTSGVTGYAGFAISGADITFNNNPGAVYTLNTFKVILVHEIGHALGLADVDVFSGPNGNFIDDNYNSSSNANIVATLNNPFAQLINPSNPGASPLQRYTIQNANPGFDTPGVNILMETSIPQIFFDSGAYLTADDVAGRQFLYPVTLAPPLSITRDGADIVISWPDTVGWSPWRSSTLAAGSWTKVTTTTTLQGNTRILRVPANQYPAFFRLQRFSP